MIRRLDDKERILIPKEIRKELGLVAGSSIDMEAQDNKIILSVPKTNNYKQRIDKAIDEIQKELKENHHLSYGVALTIINILNNCEFLEGDK